MAILFAIYLPTKWYLKRIYGIVDDNYSWVYQIENVQVEEQMLSMQGWAFALGKDAAENNYEIVLHDINTGKRVFPHMEYEIREDGNNYFFCEYDYRNSGFLAEFAIKKNEVKNNQYEIILKSENAENAYSTGIFLVDGKIQYVHPEQYVPLQIEGTDLEEVVSEGRLRVYRPDYGMYVYQYENDLYWIAEKKYAFVEGDTTVQFQMETTQISNLPLERQNENLKWDNKSFKFSKNELTEWNTGEYRVTKRALPTEYSIAKIWTGNYRNGWIWQQYFRPWYEFDTK